MAVLNTTELMAATSEILISAGYAQGDIDVAWRNENSRLFEDAYCVVGVRVYPSWQELAEQWIEAQSELIQIMSDHLQRTEAKAWDGYLVLITVGVPKKTDQHVVENIRYDTHRVRKLVVTGYDLESLSDVKRTLLPLLPLETEIVPTTITSSLGRLPDMISGPDIPKSSVITIIEAFLAQEPIIDRLHSTRKTSA